MQSIRGPIRNLAQNAHMDCSKSSSASVSVNLIADELHKIQFMQVIASVEGMLLGHRMC